MGSFRRYRDTFIVVLLLAVPFFFLRANIRNPEEMSAVDRALMRVAAPFNTSPPRSRVASPFCGEYSTW